MTGAAARWERANTALTGDLVAASLIFSLAVGDYLRARRAARLVAAERAAGEIIREIERHAHAVELLALRAEVDELARWRVELDHELDGREGPPDLVEPIAARSWEPDHSAQARCSICPTPAELDCELDCTTVLPLDPLDVTPRPRR